MTGRPTLRPGLRVYRRDDTHLQVGLDDPRLVLADTPDTRALLDDLRTGAGLGSLSPDAGLTLERLSQAGLLVDAGELATSRPETIAELARHGPAAAGRLAARAGCTFEVAAPEPWRGILGDWLVQAGLARCGTHDPAAVTVALSTGEPARSTLDALVREDRPHLLVRLHPDRARLGPFVVPGVTACLRCVDAHLGEHDPRRALVLEQLEDVCPGPAPYDPLVAHAVAALAARDVTSYADGDRPASWSATLTIGSDLSIEVRSWPRHPHCGCSWA